jgi:hypothetical protein
VPVLVAVMVIALAIVAIVLATAPAKTQVTLREVVYSDVGRTAAALQELVAKNTK